VAPAQEGLIQLLLAEYLLDENKLPEFTEHVLGVLQRNARVANRTEPKAIKIDAFEIQNSAGGVCAVGEKLVNINYQIVP
jgi:hypothetical protein